MGALALSWAIAVVSGLVAAVSAVRLATTKGENRFTAGGDLLMGLCMAAMALPATVGWYASYGMWWSVAFGILGFVGVAMGVKHTRECGWKQGRHWVHLVVGNAGMVIMTLAMTSTSSGPVLALGGGHSTAHMPGVENTASTTGMHEMVGTEPMEGMGSMCGHGHGMDMAGMTSAATDAESSADSGSVWRYVIVALALYFLLSTGASLWARIRGAGSTDGPGAGARFKLERWLLAMPDTVFVFLASLTISVWDKAGMAQRSRHGRRGKVGAAPDAALAAHIGMGGTMAAMLLMMAV
ncbi:MULTISPECIES: DUF5134 domain-containing protein [Streptomyces]|uniref:DUF5134 domain-containing protein n=1 Tax=Streptomyces plicatus TaxID=1922 RepID=A0ABW1Y4V5_STRPL|nr:MULTISPECIES: DUF5134 domain-containing protein [Streptomyces]MBJ6622291.1 DUF5134 domain-containing protein [Streptomyces sp. DHE17-7]RIH60477.1 DUF5134 domain-containing protein [Streptomyces sp. SHP22-7]RSS66338.1 DUF5134 domain-containing protein [Streptomyces sp. WAC06273]GGZ73157.1 hypothetical protein GCM10010301_53380 [Streptomyces plicatus]GHC27859.1 hypothetical protein GCM10010308_51170 [Streptomyces vinaceusdrappus]